MNRSDYASALRHHAERMAIATANADLTTRVPSCPDWTLGDLLFHTGTVHRFWTAIADGTLTDPEAWTGAADAPEDDAELPGWLAAGAEACAAAVEVLDPEEPRWSWSTRRDAGFIQRRLAHETAVHTWDALNALGRDEAIERELAADGVEEFLSICRHPAPPAGFPADGLHLHATDGPGEWTLRVAGDGTWQLLTEHAKGAVAVRGTASELLLFLWQRRTPADLEVFGTPEDLAAALTAFRRN
ncbi:maleylpyruvate isomerase family mycothiol-dependent enzyme [Kitasatospora sp. NPDC051853]|uniref:maleylpyruvate isomerase family mycothiol-dependent enzyme n=1 Tax=Kitasatospora sp. NPDC051853 TaxID=3364058 RepID=UPI0037A423DD